MTKVCIRVYVQLSNGKSKCRQSTQWPILYIFIYLIGCFCDLLLRTHAADKTRRIAEQTTLPSIHRLGNWQSTSNTNIQSSPRSIYFRVQLHALMPTTSIFSVSRQFREISSKYLSEINNALLRNEFFFVNQNFRFRKLLSGNLYFPINSFDFWWDFCWCRKNICFVTNI